MPNVVKGRFKLGLLVTLIAIHVVCVWGLIETFHQGLSCRVAAAAFLFYCARGIGITVGYHRYWTHGAFKCKSWVQYALAVCGALAMQKPIRQWRQEHRQHHAYTDLDWDPHSPKAYPETWKGFLWSHVGWMLWETLPAPQFTSPIVADSDRIVRWQERFYWPISIGLGFVLPYYMWGLPGLWWCGFIGVVGFLHITWCVNSVCHLWGSRPEGIAVHARAVGTSCNNALVAVAGFGEGWHFNHHAKQDSAHLGRDHWFDPGWWCIRILERCGAAWDVKTFSR